jgi:hypothetical protein
MGEVWLGVGRVLHERRAQSGLRWASERMWETALRSVERRVFSSGGEGAGLGGCVGDGHVRAAIRWRGYPVCVQEHPSHAAKRSAANTYNSPFGVMTIHLVTIPWPFAPRQSAHVRAQKLLSSHVTYASIAPPQLNNAPDARSNYPPAPTAFHAAARKPTRSSNWHASAYPPAKTGRYVGKQDVGRWVKWVRVRCVAGLGMPGRGVDDGVNVDMG